MNEHRTISILRRFTQIREITAAYLGLGSAELARVSWKRPTQPQLGAPHERRRR